MSRSNAYRQQLNHQSQQEWIFMIHMSNKCFHSAAFHESEEFPYLYHTLSFVSFSKTISKKTPSLLQLWFPQSFELRGPLGPFWTPHPNLWGPDQWCILIAGHVLGTGHPPCWAKGQNLGHTLGITTHLNLGASDHHGHPPGSDLGSKWAGHCFWAGHCG